MTFGERFWHKVDRSGGPDACWPWTASTHSTGYGQFMTYERGRQKNMLAHRVALALSGVPVPAGRIEVVLHLCDNPPCCNPRHLKVGTQSENIRMMVARGRGAVGDLNGMRLHPDRVPRGERNGRATLSSDDVRAIRALRTSASQRTIAARFGCSRQQVSRILRHESRVAS